MHCSLSVSTFQSTRPDLGLKNNLQNQQCPGITAAYWGGPQYGLLRSWTPNCSSSSSSSTSVSPHKGLLQPKCKVVQIYFSPNSPTSNWLLVVHRELLRVVFSLPLSPGAGSWWKLLGPCSPWKVSWDNFCHVWTEITRRAIHPAVHERWRAVFRPAVEFLPPGVVSEMISVCSSS